MRFSCKFLLDTASVGREFDCLRISIHFNFKSFCFYLLKSILQILIGYDKPRSRIRLFDVLKYCQSDRVASLAPLLKCILYFRCRAVLLLLTMVTTPGRWCSHRHSCHRRWRSHGLLVCNCWALPSPMGLYSRTVASRPLSTADRDAAGAHTAGVRTAGRLSGPARLALTG
jgi:hypothetical protein